MGDSATQRIVRTPGVCGGKARIAGHRVRVLDVVMWHEFRGMTPDEIVTHIPAITLADVHSALAYYFDHVAEIQEAMRAEAEFAEEIHRGHPSRLEASAGGKLRLGRLEEAS